METKDMYWDVVRTSSHHCMWNFIKGIRGCGKTYTMKKYLIERYKKQSKQFLWIRRSEEELKKQTTQKNGRFFKDVQKEFPNHVLWAEANVLYMDKEIIGYAQALNTGKKLKGDTLQNIHNIVFDEYLIDSIKDPYARYLPDEFGTFLELSETVGRYGSRDFEPTFWFLGNNISSDDPYTANFNLQDPYGKDIWKRGEFLVQYVAPPKLIEAKKATRFYQSLAGLPAGDKYRAYAMENESLRDNKTFIKKKGQHAEYQYALLYYNEAIGVWQDYRNGCFFISDSVDKQCREVYACTTEEQQPNVLLLKGFKNSKKLKMLKQAYDLGCVYYENQKLANWFRDIIRMGL